MSFVDTVILTRELGDDRDLERALTARGFRCLHCPCVKTQALHVDTRRPPGGVPWDQFVAWVFTSKRAVLAAAQALPLASDTALWATVGATTAHCLYQFTRKPVFTAESDPTGKALARALLSQIPSKGMTLYPCGEITTGHIQSVFRDRGRSLLEWPVYRTIRPSPPTFDHCPPAILVLTSPSAAQWFFSCHPSPEWLRGVVAIGPTTASAIAVENVRVEIAHSPDTNGLFLAVLRLGHPAPMASDSAIQKFLNDDAKAKDPTHQSPVVKS